MAVVSKPLIRGDNGHFHISGELGFGTVNALLEESRVILFGDAVRRLDLDLAGVSRADSAGLALLIQWMRMAQQGNKTIYFHNIPQQMLAIAHAGELESLLPQGD